MNVSLSKDEINLILSSVGVVLNIVTDQKARTQLLELQAKLLAIVGD